MTQPLTLHCVGLPHTTTSREHCACAYTAKVYKFCQMMHQRGHTVYHYGTEGSNPPCTEHVTILTQQVQQRFFGQPDYRHNYYPIEWGNQAYWTLTNERAIQEINKRLTPPSFVCLIGGLPQAPIMQGIDSNKALTVEYGIGYYGVFAPYRVYESYAHMHVLLGKHASDPDGRFFDAVIPNYFDADDFTFNATPDDYFLFVGRMIARKGLQIAIEATREAGVKLLMAGQGATLSNGILKCSDGCKYDAPNVEFIGYLTIEERNRVMGRAKALLAPTQYVEPFGGVAVEAMLTGSPAITTNFGAFTETVEHGATGFRCSMLREFVQAIHSISKIDREYPNQRAVSLYSLEAVAPMYEAYFNRLLSLWGKGWYELACLSEGGYNSIHKRNRPAQ